MNNVKEIFEKIMSRKGVLISLACLGLFFMLQAALTKMDFNHVNADLAMTAVPPVAQAADTLPPQGFYDYCSDYSSSDCLSHLDKIGSAGFKIVLPYESGTSGQSSAALTAYANRAQQDGIQVIWDFNELIGKSDAANSAVSVVNIVKSFPATWGYYVGDESSPSQEPSIKAMSSAIKTADPNHSSFFVGNYESSAVKPFVNDADVLGLDVYPIGDSNNSSQMISEVGAVTKDLNSYSTANNKKMAMVLQSFSWSQYSSQAPSGWNSNNFRFPTKDEVRQMRNQVLANSSPAFILWFTYYDLQKSTTLTWDDFVAAALGTDSGGTTTAKYALTVNSGSGSGSYISGQQITISANAAPSRQVFDKWTGDTSYVSNATSASAVVTMPARAITLSATYKAASSTSYQLTVSGGSGSGSYASDTKVTITANAAPRGKVFDRWTGDTSCVSNTRSATTTVTMPSKAITLTATYRSRY
jgi:hypothetical protein